jgi:hypothetical protein
MLKRYVVGISTLVVAASLFSFSTPTNGAMPSREGKNEGVVTLKGAVFPASRGTEYKGYREWKANMLESAQRRLQRTRQLLDQQRMVSNSKVDPNLQQQVAKEQLQVVISSELSITDYFVGYLNKQTDLIEAIKSTSGKLNAEEVAELMTAFAYNFNKTKTKDSKTGSNATQNSVED